MTSKSSEVVLRYTPGQDYVFVNCKFRRSSPGQGGKLVMGMALQLSLYKPWDPHHHLVNLQCFKLKCAEHYKVPNEFEPQGEARHDGFVFQSYEKPAKRWHNQYPRASYGQVSDAADRYLFLDWVGAGMSAKELVALEATDTGVTELQDGVSFLGNIRRGLVTISKAPDWDHVERSRALRALHQHEVTVKGLVEEAMGKKCKIMQVMYEPRGEKDDPILMDWFDVVFEDEPEYLHTAWEDGRGQRRLVPPVDREWA